MNWRQTLWRIVMCAVIIAAVFGILENKFGDSIQLQQKSGGIIHSFVDESIVLPSDITVIETTGEKVPKITGNNGSMWILTTSGKKGWTLKAGETLVWQFEKVQLEKNQTLAMGYIKDGCVYWPQIFQEEKEGEYQVTSTEGGEYYLYCVCASSDPLTIEKGELVIRGGL